VNARWVPPEDFQVPEIRRPTIGLCDGQVACAWVGPGQARGLELDQVDAWFEEMANCLDAIDIEGEWIDRLDELVARNADHLIRDFAGSRSAGFDDRPTIPGTLVGPSSRLHVHPTARVDPDTCFDTRGGPITIEAGVIIHSASRIEGPCWIGENSRLIHANLAGGVSLGADCRIAGRVEQSILLGRSNKFDDGSLRHAYVGEWVNLGGVASNHDQRVDPGETSVPPPGHYGSSQRARIGCFLGDHTHSSIGGFLNTGTDVGVMCTILSTGSAMARHVPSFSVIGFGRFGPESSLEEVFATAEITMERRGQEFTEDQRQLYRYLYEQSRPDRRASYLGTFEPCHESRRIAESVL
jgi:hypothetical protein